MKFTLAVLTCVIGLATAAPATKTETDAESSKIEPKDHPKLELFQEQNYTLDEVLDELQREREEQHVALKKSR